uniref:4Fe-4S dicluster domain-containing protein n=2 Tax=Thermogladius calderae TaxID=1200300 RepID=A0A7J3XYX0_9CREN
MRVVVEPSRYKIPLARPSIGVAGKTGSWRLEKPIVDNNACTRCFLCEIHCPVNVIRVEPDTGVSIDYDYCKGCGLCADVCPVGAIKMLAEE